LNSEAIARRRGFDWYAILTFALAALWQFGIGSLLALYVGRRSLRGSRPSRTCEVEPWSGPELRLRSSASF
jgi:hypothetical protein